jgi:RNA-directed DNA polymerase
VIVQEAKQTEETYDKWSWAEPSIWTARMLNTLETGVKGGKWFSLIDKVYKRENLLSAFNSVKSNKGTSGIDNISISKYEAQLEHNLGKLKDGLENNQYSPLAVKRVYIDKPGSKEKRPLGIPAVRDRIAQKALCNVIEPIFETVFAPDSYGFRPGKGCKDALREVQAELKSGRHYVIDADIKSYFDTIEHECLMQLVEEQISDGRVLELIRRFLKQEVIDEMNHWTPEKGSPQGGVLSPLLANIYLNELDYAIPETGIRMIRYADDLVIMCETLEQAEYALNKVRRWCDGRKLTLHPDKTRIVNMTQPSAYFEFLGYRFKRTIGKGKIIRVPRQKSIKSLCDKVRHETRRTNGRSIKQTITSLNPKISGWFEYYKHSHESVFIKLDGWIRMRLRSILRKQTKRKGRGRGKDHLRYPNQYFHDLELFSLEQSRQSLVQPLRC